MYNNKTIWNIAYPIMFGNLAQTLINLTDTAFLGRLSEVALGAAAFAGIYYFVIATLAWGFALGVQVIIARRFGEQRFERIGIIFHHGAIFSAALGLILFALLHFLSPTILRVLIDSDHVYNASLEYINPRSFGIFFVSFNMLFRALYVGISNTKAIAYTTAIMAIINIIFDWAMIFGKLGFPAMGIQGAAIASVMSEAAATIFFIIYSYKTLPLKEYALFIKHKFEIYLLKTTLKIALPTMFQKLMSFGTWLVFFSMVEKLGERALASTMISRSVYLLMTIPVFAYGTTANTLVSRAIGEGKANNTLNIILKVVKMLCLTMLPIGIIVAIFPQTLLSIYTDNIDLINYSTASIYPVIVAAFCLGLGMVFFESISGTGNTDQAVYIEAIVLACYISYTYLVTIHLHLNVEWVWGAEWVYGLILALGSYLYLKHYNWQARKRGL